MTRTLKQRSLAVAVSAVLATLSHSAFADGRVEGRVDREGGRSWLTGAVVRLVELDRETSTGDDGRFTFGRVPAGSYTLDVSYLGLASVSQKVNVQDDVITRADATLAAIEEIVVYGQASSTASALNQQRVADQITSIVTSDDFGQLPDANLSEALQRVPGVFLLRDQGEGRFVGIRGIDPNLNVTQINGVVVPSPERDTRAVALDVVPSELLETLSVTRTFTPDMDPNGIGGSINVESLSAFDRNGMHLQVKAEGSYNELEEKLSPKTSLVWSNTFGLAGDDNFGIAFAASWFDRELGSDNIETDGGWPDDLETVAGREFKGAEEIEHRDYVINRERLGAALNLDWRPTDTQTVYLRTLFSEFSDQEYRTRDEYKFDDGEAQHVDDEFVIWNGATMDREMKDRYEEQKILSVVAGGSTLLDDWTIDYDYGYSQSEEREPDRIDSVFVIEDLSMGYTKIGAKPDLFVDGSVRNARNFVLDEVTTEDNFTEDTAHSLRLDVSREFDWNEFETQIRFGVKLQRREKTDDLDLVVFDGFPGDPTLFAFQAGEPDHGFANFSTGVDAGAVRRFIEGNRAALDIDDDDTLIASLGGDYEMNEDVNAAYLMSRMELGDIRVVYGVRYEQTDFDAEGFRLTTDDIGGSGDPEPALVTFSNDYDQILPSINLRYSPDDALVVRGAWSMTFARPSFGELRPGGEIVFEEDDGDNVLEAEVGNPELDPLEASNFDLVVEYYDEDIGLLSAGVFYKSIKNFIAIADVADVIDLSTFVGNAVVHDAEVIMPINGDDAELFGVELAWVKKFSSLPAPLNGLLVSANATLTDSEAELPGRDGNIPLPRQSDHVVNLALGYEAERFSARVAATWKSEALLGIDELDDPAFDIYQDNHVQVDLSVKLDLTDALQVYFDANNLTNEPFYAFYSTRRYNAVYERYGRSFALGIRYLAP
jgi:TonB-dependent receptor